MPQLELPLIQILELGMGKGHHLHAFGSFTQVEIRHNFDVVTLIRERVEYNKRKKGIYEITNH